MGNWSYQRGKSARRWQVLGILIVAAYVVVQFIRFQISLASLPDTWTIGGQAFPNQTLDEAIAQIDDDLQQPVMLHYLTSTVQLEPATVNFTFDVTETLRAAREARTRSASLTDFLRHLIWQPPAARDIPIVASYSDEKARAFLADIATRWDAPPRPPVPQVATLSLSDGQSGHLLNIVASMDPLEAALKSVAERDADLVVDEQARPAPTIDQLEQLLQARLAQFQGVAGVFVKDLQTGQELAINGDVPFSSGGVLKLPIALEIYRKYDEPLDITTTQRLTSALTTELSNLPANQLLNQIGDGNTFVGVETLTASMSNLGLRNTYLAQPYDQPITATASISTPANTNPAVNTNASPSAQTTPSDMGSLWEMIYQCSQSGGPLLIVYPDQLTPVECQHLIDLIDTYWPADAPSLLRDPTLDQAVIAHRPGGNFDTRSDAALVHSPGGDYVLVVFLNTANQNFNWNAANAVMSDLSRATYNYFNYQ
jgi:beta-lactamase class A